MNARTMKGIGLEQRAAIHREVAASPMLPVFASYNERLVADAEARLADLMAAVRRLGAPPRKPNGTDP